jgi:hypothetical protein
MNSGKYSWLKKNPIVLLLRRLYRRFFKPKQNFVRFNPEYHLVGDDQNNIVSTNQSSIESLPISEPEIEAEEYDDVFVTIGQLFEQVNWQNNPAIIPAKRPIAKRAARTISTTQDQGGFATVGELFQQVKWRVPAKVIQEQFLNTSKSSQSYDVSLN